MASGLLANFNRSTENTLFYKLTSQEPYSINFSLLNPALPSYNAEFYVNNTLVFNNTITDPAAAFINLQLDRTSPCLCSFNINLSTTDNTYLTSYEISAKFVPYFLSADFIGFPGSYFTTPAGTLKTLSFNDFIQSPGLFFYGEGHQETVYLSAINPSPDVTEYFWTVAYRERFATISTSTFTLGPEITGATGATGVFKVDPKLDYRPGQIILVEHNFLNYFKAFVEAYDSINGSLTAFPITEVVGVGTYSLWNINLDNSVPSIRTYPVTTSNIQPYTSAAATLTSDSGTDIRVPISLHVTNSLFVSSDPKYFRDDVTGEPVYYPYYITTVDLFENQLPTNDRFKDSIYIKPYTPIEFIFTPGIDNVIYLPINGSQVTYEAILRTAVEGTGILSACYDRYGFIWNWANFENCLTSPDTFINKASSWATVECSGTFPKVWRNLTPDEIAAGLLSAEPFSVNPITCSATPITWTLSTANWSIVTENSATNNYDYFLSLDNLGTDLYTTNIFENTDVLLNVDQSFTCQISADLSQAPGYINDWRPRDLNLNLDKKIISVAPPDLKIYTPNRFVLTGTNVWFQYLGTNLNLITGLEIDFDDGKTLFLTGSDVQNTNYFNTTYEVVGFKTITLRAFVSYDITPITETFPDIIQILDSYDDVSPLEYRSSTSSLELPWPNKPQVGLNDWVTEDNINSNIKKFYENLQYLESRSRVYPGTFSDYFGYLGVPPTVVGDLTACPKWTWEDVDCLNTSLPYTVTWRDVLSAESPLDTGVFALPCGTWEEQECTQKQINPTCFGKYDLQWQWRSLKARNSIRLVTWRDTKCADGEFAKRWLYEPSANSFLIPCDEGVWNVNIPKLDTFYDPIANPAIQIRCTYFGVTSRNNNLYLAQKTQIKLLSSDYNAFYFSYRDTLDGVVGFSDIKNICIDTEGKVYILDGVLNQVGVYTYEPDTPGEDWQLFIQWGGFGTAASTNKFSRPNDIHIDQLDNIWVCDTGNGCVKVYSNTGTWLRTILDDSLKIAPPLSLCVDSQKNVHILTQENIRVYSYTGEFLFEYDYKSFVSSSPRKINTSFNREVIYLACDSQVIKFFRNGVFYSYIIQQKENVSNITGIYHDEYRNLLITTNDKVLKYPDKMTLVNLKGTLPDNYWPLEDLYIHKEEYIQNWVYTKSLQRLWDNIEIFRSTLLYKENSFCKGYKPPIHGKEKIIIGQNELVTSTVVNRVLDYLWDNFYSLLDYFDPDCQEPFNP
jgi:hypothetical protein